MSSPPSVTPSFTRPRVYTLSPDWSRIFTPYMHHMEQDIVNCSSTQLLKIVVDCPTLLISRHQCCECCEFFLPFPSRHIGEEKRGEMSSMMSPAPLSHPTILLSIVPLISRRWTSVPSILERPVIPFTQLWSMSPLLY